MIRKNIFSIIVALVILLLSLLGSGTLEKVDFMDLTFTDKIAHFGMYFGFTSVIIYENRKKMMFSAIYIVAALIPFFYGILMEFLQEFMTTTRSGNIYDVLFNTAGIIASISIWLLFRSHINRIVK
jgi:VanZ family protein